MADVFKTYQYLNEALGLQLSQREGRGHEMMDKRIFAEELGLQLGPKTVNDWEFFVYLKPRRGVRLRVKQSPRR